MQRFEGALTVDVGRDAVVNVTLQVGQLNTKVEVLDVTPVVQTSIPALLATKLILPASRFFR